MDFILQPWHLYLVILAGEHIPAQLEAARLAARQSRLKCNREWNCHACQAPAIISC